MGFINNIAETGKTIYEVDVETLKKMVAADLGVNIEAVSVSVNMKQMGYPREESVFAGLRITVDHSKVIIQNGQPIWRKPSDSTCSMAVQV
jgi:hypothetical protein